MTHAPRDMRRFHIGFVAVVFALGLGAIADAQYTLATGSLGSSWLLFSVLTIVTGAFAIKVPALNVKLSISETFVFALTLMFGGAPAVVTVALDGLVMALFRRNNPLRRVLFNLAEPAVSIWVAAKVYYLMAGIPPLQQAPASLGSVGVPAIAMAGAYFVMNTVLNALAMATEAGTSPIALWRKYALWVSLNFFGGVSIAVLLAVNSRTMELGSLVAIAPLVLVSYFTFKSSMGRLEDENVHLAEVNRLYLKVVETLAMAVDAKDQVTHGHIRRVQTFALRLARELGVTSPDELMAIEAAALLHDMGKLAVPEHILNKPGRLTATEYERMKLHAPLGADMLSAVGFPYPVVPIVRHHHENWDGSGYPDQLAGEAIPIGARVLSVVDCYDALRSHRPYRRSLSPEQAFAIVSERRGSMYDPRVVDAFSLIRDEIEAETVEEPLPAVLDQLAKAARDQRGLEVHAESLSLDVRLAASHALVQMHDQLSRLDAHADVRDVCAVVERHVRTLAPAGLVAFLLHDDSAEVLRVAYAEGYGESCLDGMTVPMGHGVSGWAAAHAQSVLNADPALDVEERFRALAPPLRSIMAVPLTVERSVVGVVSLFAMTPGAFSDDQQRSVELLAGAIAEALRRAAVRSGAAMPARIVDAEHALATMLRPDSLWRPASARNAGVLYLLCDDAEVMGHAAVAVNQATRVSDLIFRARQNELLVLMPDCDATSGQAIAWRVSDFFDTVPDGSTMLETIRFGFACTPHDGTSLSDLLAAARDRVAEAPDRSGVSMWTPAAQTPRGAGGVS